MSDLDQNIPDDFWRKAFDEAAETPPPRVWDAVEHRLNEDNGPKIMPLWGTGLASSRPLVWGMGVAATIALLLVGRWLMQSAPPGNQVAVQQTPGQTNRAGNEPTPMATDGQPSKQVPVRPSLPGEQAGETVALNQKPTLQDGRAASVYRKSPLTAESSPQSIPDRNDARSEAADAQPSTNMQSIQLPPRPTTLASSTVSRAASRIALVNTDAPALPPLLTNPALPETASSSSSTLPTSAGQTLFFEPIQTLALRLRNPGPVQRIVWFRPAEPPAGPDDAQSARKKREVWASVGLMPGAFDPSVTVQSVQASFADARALNSAYVNQPSVNSRANFSVAYQAGAGIQLTERWSVESGVGYLSGRSTVGSPVQTTALTFQSADAAYSGQSANLYVDALRTSSSRALANNLLSNSSLDGFSNLSVNNRYSVQNGYNPQSRQSLTNDYQFVQVPVQIGYQLRPRKRLSLALLGGLLSNIFVRNTVGDNLVITTKDGVYRPVSWAATMGARFRYRPSRQWSASLAGVYQPSLGLGTRPESAVQTRPTSTGLSFGVDYHF